MDGAERGGSHPINLQMLLDDFIPGHCWEASCSYPHCFRHQNPFRMVKLFMALRREAVGTLQFLDERDILGLSILWGRLRVHELLPSVVLVFPLWGTTHSVDILSNRPQVFSVLRLLTLKSKAPGLGASSNLVSWVPTLYRAYSCRSCQPAHR